MFKNPLVERIFNLYYVVPPLEDFWWQDNIEGVNYTDKSSFNWISVIRLPDFVEKKDFGWAVETATKKRKLDCSSAEFMTIDEGCAKMHLCGCIVTAQ